MTTKIATGKFVWFEYVTKEIQKAQGFFGELFGWTTQEMPMPQGSYTMIASEGEMIGGYQSTPAGAPAQAHWLSYLQVESADKSAELARSLGGKIAQRPMQVGDAGTMAVVLDPTGGAFALWQPAKPEGSGDYKGRPGTWCWNELWTGDPGAAVEFYKRLGGFEEKKMESPGMGTYHILETDGKGRAGVFKSPAPDVPTMWLPYVFVADADKTVERAKKLGASAQVPPTDIPNIGRFAVIIDPQGAALGIIKPAA